MAVYVFITNRPELNTKVGEVKVSDDGTVEWALDPGNWRKSIESGYWPNLIDAGVSEDGSFDPKNPKHWEVLPKIFRGPYNYCIRVDVQDAVAEG